MHARPRLQLTANETERYDSKKRRGAPKARPEDRLELRQTLRLPTDGNGVAGVPFGAPLQGHAYS